MDNLSSRFVAEIGTSGQPFIPVLATNREQWLWARSEDIGPGSCLEPGAVRRTGTNDPRGPAGSLGARTGTYALMGPGSWLNRD